VQAFALLFLMRFKFASFSRSAREGRHFFELELMDAGYCAALELLGSNDVPFSGFMMAEGVFARPAQVYACDTYFPGDELQLNGGRMGEINIDTEVDISVDLIINPSSIRGCD
jgi:hypothetical protein